ncbi:Urea ABC transporter, permease protein UrtC [Paraburkholderia caribensis MBA4]|uniref:Urea ABC transporter, permease protein UrtC n=1 Tax=Paraburkholderia caribensis MBA4 TaxID=1323664 RepID=A0A0P0RI45_9BURK|nr:ATP-binding cassette domain-containing protein [Paraburkholderia caribensis]ALL68316.1 Urea ABC transporter, permease protein UrtC [Paraburkholderia caribensis MBA4]
MQIDQHLDGESVGMSSAELGQPAQHRWFIRISRRGLVWPLLIAIAALVVGPHLPTPLLLKSTLWLSFGIAALSLDLVWGKAGIFSFGQNALFGVGAYAYAVSALNLFPATHETASALILAVLASAAFAGFLGYILFYGRIGDVYFAIVTLAVTLVFYTVISSTSGPEFHIGEAQLGGFNGIPSVPSITLGIPGNTNNTEFSPAQLFAFAICLSCFLYGLVKYLMTGRFGELLAGVRENELRMELLGYDTRKLKLAVFVVGGAIAGAGGGLFAAWGTFVNPSLFSLSQAALVVIWVMVGGRGSLVGAFVGVALVQWISDAADVVVSQQTPLVLGVLLIATVLLAPSGLFPLLSRPVRRLFRVGSLARPRSHSPRSAIGDDVVSSRCTDEEPETNRISERQLNGRLVAKDVKKSFGGLTVLRGVSIEFSGPGIHVVIGANGAGKSTLFSVLTGRYLATSGLIELDGQNITGIPTYKRARHGLGIKTQVPSLFPGLTVAENLALACRSSNTNTDVAHVRSTLDSVGLQRKKHVLVSQLAHGEQQWLEIAMVLSQNPSVILLDEPAAGMTSDERAGTVRLIKRLALTHTVIVVEHDMNFIRSLDAPISMLHQGEIFKRGTFEEMISDPTVIDAYLGRKHVTQR